MSTFTTPVTVPEIPDTIEEIKSKVIAVGVALLLAYSVFAFYNLRSISFFKHWQLLSNRRVRLNKIRFVKF